MGLDVYVGSFTRYYARDWETVVQQAGRLQGVQVNVIRTTPEAPDAITDPEQINAGILRWRAGLNLALRNAGVISADVDWDERVDAPYFTDKPAWDCFGALNLLAAYEEEPKPLFGGRFPKQLSDKWPEDAKFLRRSGDKSSRFAHLYGCEVWLPLDMQKTFEGPRPNGQPTRFGSSIRLLEQLNTLNQATYRGNPADLEQWRRDMPEGNDPAFEPKAKTGLSIMLALTTAAVQNRLPMLLDY